MVKRAGQMGNGGFADSHPPAGSKRSVRDRLGSDVDGTSSTINGLFSLYFLVVSES